MPVFCLEVILGLFATKHFDDVGTSEHKKEENTYIMFRDLIDEYEGCDVLCMPICVYNLLVIADPNDLMLEKVLSFFTGATRVPIGGFDCGAILRFSPGAYYPSANTCSLELILPTQYHDDESLFKERCTFGFNHPCGFGRP